MAGAWDFSAREQQVLAEIPRRLGPLAPRAVILFGSRATGHAKPDSDFDLALVMDLRDPTAPRTVEARRRLLGLGVPFDIVVFTPEEWSSAKDHPLTLAHHIAREGRVLLGAA